MTNAPHVEQLLVDDLTVDREVQRSLDQNRVRKILADFDVDALGTITVNLRADGTVHVVDGQHRVEALRQKGDENGCRIRCLVYEGLDRAGEAALFRRLNNTRPVHSLDKFRVRVVEGDPVAVALSDMLAAHGWAIRAGSASGSFSAVSALEAVYRGPDGEQADIAACDTTIMALTKAWGHDAHAVRAELVGGVGAVIGRHHDAVDTAKLIAELGKQEGGALGFSGRSKTFRESYGGTLRDAVAQTVIGLLNKGRRTKILPNWRS